MKYEDFQDKKRLNDKVIVPALDRVGYNKIAQKILNCSNRRIMALCKKCGTFHFNGSISCHNRFCAVCQKKRSLLWFMRMFPIFKFYLESNTKLVFVTFTIKNTETLEEGLNTLQDGWRYMTKDAKKIANAFKALFRGGVRSIEVKRGKNSGLWHPHMHCIFVMRGNHPFKKLEHWLRSFWNTCLCTIHKKVEKLGSVKLDKINVLNDGIQAICETFKYSTKFDWEHDDKDIVELVETLKGRRMITPFGCIKGLINEDSIEHDLLLPFTELKKQFCVVCGNDTFDAVYYDKCDRIPEYNIMDFDDEVEECEIMND